jgi:hypothetical protein
MKKISQKYTAFVFGEGRKDKKFLIALIELEKFKYHTRKWNDFIYGNSHGCSPEDILKDCKKATASSQFDLIMCFIDLDKLKMDYPDQWLRKQQELENKYKEFCIIWQLDCIEDEMKKVLGNIGASKGKLNKLAKENVKKFINSDYWRRILDAIKLREEELVDI